MAEENGYKEMTAEAVTDNIPVLTEFVDSILESVDCPMKTQIQMDVVLDELLCNIARYAYEGSDGPGQMTVGIEILEDPKRAVFTFKDQGVPYNPLEKEDPDITGSAEERSIGGLGIFIVKKSVDEMTYERSEDSNILRLVKNL